MDKEMWPSGLRVLVIDENSSYLSVMEELLLKCCYKVTTFENVRQAMRFICSNLQTVDLIISDAFFPVEDGLLILQQVTSKFDIPTVIMSSNGDTGTVMKYITNGASDFLIKPVRIEELKNIWQHVFRKKIGEERGKNSNTQHVVDQVLYPPNVAPSPSPARSTGITEASMALMDSEVREPSGTVTDVKDLRKSRLSWTRQLHHQFVTAVDSLGVEKAVPKKILEVMNVKHLRREQVASHLQKYRLHLRTSTQALHKDDAASSSSHPHESSNLKTQLFDHSPNSVYLNQDGCMEITDYSLPKDDLSSGSDCILDEQNNYSPEGFQNFSLVSDKQASDTYLWNFEAE